MKKTFALFLSLLMLAFPVLGSAATMDGILAKYTDQGCEVITDISFQIGSEIQQLIPEDVRGIVDDLLNALSFQFRHQGIDDMEQDGFSLILSGKDALRFDVAAAPQGVYASTSLFGDRIFALSSEEIASLLKQVTHQLVENGILTEEQLSEIIQMVQSAIADPAGFLSSMIGEPDLTGLLTVLENMIGRIAIDEDTAPEAFPEGVTSVRITITPEDMHALATESAKLIASLPAFDTLSRLLSLTEDSLTKALCEISDIFASDLVITVWLNEDGSALYLTAAIQLKGDDGHTIQENETMLVRVTDNGVQVSFNVTGTDDESEVVRMSLDCTVAGNEFNGTYEITAEEQTLRTVFSGNASETDTTFGLTLDTTSQFLDNDESVAGIWVNLAEKASDEGDHATANVVCSIGLEGTEDALLTITANSSTDLAEAYIISDEAIYPLSLNEEELNELASSLQLDATLGLLNVLSSLPESCAPVVLSLLGIE